MTTRRLYHEDPERKTFRARVLEVRPGPEGTALVVLDRTAFYPTGGGQPHDTGRLAGLPVIDVIEEGEVVLHRVRGTIAEGEVEGAVDWDRRVDHRQQHSGQHVLSRAFLETGRAATVGFHLGAGTCTIDLDREPSPREVSEAERRANEVVQSGAVVRTDWYDRPEDLPAGLRKEAPAGERIRVISVGAFDATPCCGTHCATAAGIGAIKILGTERNRGGIRVEFVCGWRALADHENRRRLLRETALRLSTEDERTPERVAALLEDAKGLRSALERAEGEIREGLVGAWASIEPERPLVRDLGEGKSAWLVPLAGELAARRGTPVLLGSGDGADARVVLALPEGSPDHAGDRIRAILGSHEGRGGGSERLGQGKLPSRGLSGFLRAGIEALGPGGNPSGPGKGTEP